MIYEQLAAIQQTLKAPKGQYNAFGKYKYRSCEDILEAVKPLLGTLVLSLNDEMTILGNRFYVKATAKLTDGKETIEVSAFAREEETKKGMDASQITGAASSYARKYALNGLLAIDDNKDADTKAEKTELVLDEASAKRITDASNVTELNAIYKELLTKKGMAYKASIVKLCSAKKSQLGEQ